MRREGKTRTKGRKDLQCMARIQCILCKVNQMTILYCLIDVTFKNCFHELAAFLKGTQRTMRFAHWIEKYVLIALILSRDAIMFQSEVENSINTFGIGSLFMGCGRQMMMRTCRSSSTWGDSRRRLEAIKNIPCDACLPEQFSVFVSRLDCQFMSRIRKKEEYVSKRW